jgi:TusA-related sulfurtransferase
MKRLPPRTQVLLRADDPVVRTDVPAWCAMVGAQLLQIDQDEAGIFTVRITLP